jgi:hypothetical protein
VEEGTVQTRKGREERKNATKLFGLQPIATCFLTSKSYNRDMAQRHAPANVPPHQVSPMVVVSDVHVSEQIAQPQPPLLDVAQQPVSGEQWQFFFCLLYHCSFKIVLAFVCSTCSVFPYCCWLWFPHSHLNSFVSTPHYLGLLICFGCISRSPRVYRIFFY